MSVTKSKPSIVWRAGAVLWAFVSGKTAAAEASVVEIDVAPAADAHSRPVAQSEHVTFSPCCVESIVFAIFAAKHAGLLDDGTDKCCFRFLDTFGQTVPEQMHRLIVKAAHDAGRRYKRRMERRFHELATAEPLPN